ncbi:uncharacterized protein LOC134738761 [Pongo pygmaeus]|uniref:uncharacterized protein LOC134738761 n=1 Tax=Pongo pygmaeus TaxID=9600 RepID=UPI00300C32FB
MSSCGAFVLGCSAVILILKKRPLRMGIRFQLHQDRRISSRGRSLHTAKVVPGRKRLTAGHRTQAEMQKEAHQRQADLREIALWCAGHIRPKTHSHTGTHTNGQREGKKHTDSERHREKREWETHTNAHTHTHKHTHTESYSSGTETHSPRQPLRLLGSAPDENDPRLREQPRGTQADLSLRFRGHDFWGDSSEHRPGRPEAGMPCCFPWNPPVVSSSWSALCDSWHLETFLSIPWRGQVGASESRHQSTAKEDSSLGFLHSDTAFQDTCKYRGDSEVRPMRSSVALAYASADSVNVCHRRHMGQQRNQQWCPGMCPVEGGSSDLSINAKENQRTHGNQERVYA